MPPDNGLSEFIVGLVAALIFCVVVVAVGA